MERRLLVAAVTMLAFTACGRVDEPAVGVPLPTVESSADRAEPGLLGSWRFESLDVDGVPIDRQMFLDITVDGFRAETTCNQVSGTFGGEIVSTAMACTTDAANADERHMSQALRSEPVQTDDLLVFDDGSVRLVYEAFTDPLPGDLFAVLADQTLDVDESILPSEQVTGTVPPDFDTLVPLPSPSSEVDLFLAVINDHVCVVWGTDTALENWCQQPRFAAESADAVNIPMYGPALFRIALIPDRFGPGVTSRPDLGTYGNNLLVVSDNAPTGNHVLTDATGATFKLIIPAEPTTPTATSQPTTTAGMPTDANGSGSPVTAPPVDSDTSVSDATIRGELQAVPGVVYLWEFSSHCGVERLLLPVNDVLWITDEANGTESDWMPIEWAQTLGAGDEMIALEVVLSADGTQLTATKAERSVVYRPITPSEAGRYCA